MAIYRIIAGEIKDQHGNEPTLEETVAALNSNHRLTATLRLVRSDLKEKYMSIRCVGGPLDGTFAADGEPEGYIRRSLWLSSEGCDYGYDIYVDALFPDPVRCGYRKFNQLILEAIFHE